MTPDFTAPAFGQADLSNCERELIHLAGSIQPHGVLLVASRPELRVVRCSANVVDLLGVEAQELLGEPLGDHLPALEDLLHDAEELVPGAMPVPRRFRSDDGPELLAFLHRTEDGAMVVELEEPSPAGAEGSPDLSRRLPGILETLSTSATLGDLADAFTRSFREVAGYDRVMVYRFDHEGHGEILSEDRREDLEPFLGLRYPATDIPQRARQLYMRNRVRVLGDVDYDPSPLLPRETAEEMDMSQCVLRSMSPIHLQYLRNMGVTATLVASIVHRGELWGLLACHHYSPKHVSYQVRATADVLAETVATRIAVLESYKRAEAEVQVRHLEQALAEAVTSTGDWRDVLFAKPGRLLRPVGAQGAALLFDGQSYTVGETPRRVELARLTEWLQARVDREFWHTSALGEEAPELSAMVADAAGVLAFRLSRWKGEYLLWFRKERPENVRWAGNPHEKIQIGDDPMDLSPRRSFAVWNELVRGTSESWSEESLAAAEAIGLSLRDIIGQTRAMSFLLAERQLTRTRENVLYSEIPLVLADSAARILLVSQAFEDLFESLPSRVERMEDLAELFHETEEMRERLPKPGMMEGWRGTARLRTGADPMTVAVRIDPIPLPGGRMLGFVLLVNDLTAQVEIAASRTRIRNAIGAMRQNRSAPSRGDLPVYERLLASILANASLAAMEIGEPHLLPPNADQTLQEVEEATRRAARISKLIVDFGPGGGE